MSKRALIELIGSPAHLPRIPEGRVAVVDVAFASGEKYDLVTEPFIEALGDRLALWCDHHEHALGWSKYRGDPRFVLVPNRQAHACPELVTEEIAGRVGRVDAVLAHGDFDGVVTASKLLRGGVAPYLEADEDARAVDSPGRGHALSARGARLAFAVDEAVATYTAGQRRDFLRAVVFSLVDGAEPEALRTEIDETAERARHVHDEAIRMAHTHGREELPGVLVVRLQGRRKGRERKAILRTAEELARVGVVVEVDGSSRWVTAATFDEGLDLGTIDLLQGGRSDYRYCEPRRSEEISEVLREIAAAVADRQPF